MDAHPGFHGAQAAIAAREHIPMANAGAILGASAHRESDAAAKRNPRTRRVGGFGKFHKALLARRGMSDHDGDEGGY